MFKSKNSQLGAWGRHKRLFPRKTFFSKSANISKTKLLVKDFDFPKKNTNQFLSSLYICLINYKFRKRENNNLLF